MKSHKKCTAAPALASVALLVHVAHAAGPEPPGPQIIAVASMSGLCVDFATQTAGLLENGVPGSRLGGLGSRLAHHRGEYFLALADRGPNGVLQLVP